MNPLTFALLLSSVMVASGIVCLPNICKDIKCQKIENCNGDLRTNGSFCGCCPKCVTLLGKFPHQTVSFYFLTNPSTKYNEFKFIICIYINVSSITGSYLKLKIEINIQCT